MLLRSVFLIALICVLAQAVVAGSGALAKATLHQRAAAAARSGLVQAMQRAQSALATSAQNGTQVAFPAPSTSCVASGSAGCMLSATTTLTAEAAPTNAAAPCPAAHCTIYAQNNDQVAEGRAGVHIVVAVGAPGGDAIASREATVRFRTLRVAPYAIVAGANDASIDALVNGSTGDDGGANDAGASTLINVVYRNGATTIPANVWGTRMENPQQSHPSWDR